MVTTAVFVIVFATAANAFPSREIGRTYNINNVVDKMLAWHNAVLTKHGDGVIRIPDGKFDEVAYSHSSFVGMNSFVRKLDCTNTTAVNGYTITCPLSFRVFALIFGILDIGGVQGSAIYDVKETELDFSFSAITSGPGSCDVAVNKLAFVDFSHVEFRSTVAKWDGHNPGILSDTNIGKHINDAINEKKARLAQHIKPVLCH